MHLECHTIRSLLWYPQMCVSSHSGSIEQEHRWTRSQNLVTVPSFPQVYVMIPASQESHYDALISS